MAMTIADYEERIEKCNSKIEKINKRIAKWEGQKNEQAFIIDKGPWYGMDSKRIKKDALNMTLRDLATVIWNYYAAYYSEEDMHNYLGNDVNDYLTNKLEKEYEDWLKHCDSEIRSANRDLDDTNNTIATYRNRIAMLEVENAKPVIQIFKDFFESWKAEIIEWVTPLYEEYKKVSNDLADVHNRSYWYKETIGEEAWRAKYKELEARYRELRNSPVLLRRIENGVDGFNKWLNDYMNDRYNELVDKVTKYTGEINDVSNLHIGRDGTLNGIVSGELGKAKIETIGAGGYNIQCYHYRCLVHPVK